MINRRNAITALLTLPSAITGTALAQKAATPKPQNVLALAEPYVRELLFLIETTKSGKISKREFMRFMEAEFTWLDKDSTGELDRSVLMQATTRPHRFAEAGK